MPPTLFRRQSTIPCFFCSDTNFIPKNPRNFRCPNCGCWNKYDNEGTIISDEPAMHDEYLNSKSFAKRASPSKDRIPTMYGSGSFCHTCQTNQMLLINLLSNYLPDPDSPEYAQRLEQLPEYRESLHRRYPPVCDTCLPIVEDEIRKKDHMARTKALGGWLAESRGKEKQRRVSGTTPARENVTTEIILWRIRGCFWFLTLLVSIAGSVAGALGSSPTHQFPSVAPLLPFFTLISLLWTAWDPTYSSFRKSQLQGRTVRVKGKKLYIALQMTAWTCRLFTSILIALSMRRPDMDLLHLHNPSSSTTGNHYNLLSSKSRIYFSASFLVEISTLVLSFAMIRLQHPPAIRLLDSNAHLTLSRSATPQVQSRSTTPSMPNFPAPVEPDILAALSLSSKPIITPTKPVFGLPSLRSAAPLTSTNMERDSDEMDWTPANGIDVKGKQKEVASDDASWLRPQRFFAPENPTGLEGLFERTKIDDDAMSVDGATQLPVGRSWLFRNWLWLTCALILIPLAAALVYRLRTHTAT